MPELKLNNGDELTINDQKYRYYNGDFEKVEEPKERKPYFGGIIKKVDDLVPGEEVVLHLRYNRYRGEMGYLFTGVHDDNSFHLTSGNVLLESQPIYRDES